MIQVNEIKLTLDQEESELKNVLAKKLKISPKEIHAVRILRKSLDARKEICFSYTLAAEVNNEKKVLRLPFVKSYVEPSFDVEAVETEERIAIIGYGPAGIFAACRLVDAGVKPLIFERGKRIRERKADVDRFFREGILDPSSNVQYGEGGAGTFSDAKLTTRVKSGYIPYLLHKFISYGAPEEIAYLAHPHIGTDQIQEVITTLTDDLMAKGAEFHFGEQVTDFVCEDGKIKALVTPQGSYPVDRVIYATGHSAVDTVRVLKEKNVEIVRKSFAVGFRVEHPQELIDHVQYKGVKHPKLEASEYFLTHTSSNGRGVYSFCMCPGGYVVPAVSEPKTIVTNGMSYASRNNLLANSAILCQVDGNEPVGDELAGFAYLSAFEKKAYEISHSYKAPSQNIKDYVHGTHSAPVLKSSYALGTVDYDMRTFYTEEMAQSFTEAFLNFDRKIPGFIEQGIIVGPETRSSSPIRIPRNEQFRTEVLKNLYPCGEGSGYGGGIVSCGADGVKVADAILTQLRQEK